MLTSFISGIIRCDLFAGRTMFSVLESAGPQFCRTGGELVPIRCCFDFCLGHKWNPYWTASDPAGSPNSQAGKFPA